jgi:hypothetical protein
MTQSDAPTCPACFGFLTKMLQAFLVLPALSAAWLIAAPVAIRRRMRAAGRRRLVGARRRALA